MTAIDAPGRILGYFTLCATALAQGDVSEAARKYAPRYPLVTATLLGRLAVDQGRYRKGLGAVLLASALRKAFDSADTVGSSIVVVYAIDDRAISFYNALGFIRLGQSSRLAIAMRSLAHLG